MTKAIQPEDDARELVAPADNTDPSPEPIQQQEEAPVAKDEEPERPKIGGKFDDKRNAVAERIKAMRDGRDPEAAVEVPSDIQKRMYGDVETAEDRRRPPEEEQPAQKLEAEDIPAPTKKVLKINGKDVEVDDSQIVDHARRSLAAEDILGQAKRERDEARQLLAELQKERAIHSPAQTQQPTPAKAQAEDSKPATDAELDSVIDAIQVGTKEEAAQALAKYGDQLIKRVSETIGDLDQRVEAAANRREQDRRVKADAEDTLATFRAENADFEGSEMRQQVLFEETVHVMAEKLIDLGVKPETLENYARQHGLAPQAAVGAAYRQLMSMPDFAEKLPNPAANLREAAERVRKGLGLPAPQQQERPAPAPKADTTQILAERTERKQAMQPQPRRANVVSSQDTPPQRSKEEKDRLAVQRMRVARRGR